MKTTKEQRQKLKRVVITSAMVMAVLIVLSSNVSAVGVNELDSDTKNILYYHFKKLHYPDAQIQKVISLIDQDDVARIVDEYNKKLDAQWYPSEVKADISNVSGVIVYFIIFELFRLAMMKINTGM
jgi:hypothetical protein